MMVEESEGRQMSGREDAGEAKSPEFPNTHWTCIFESQKESTLGFDSLARLCQAYWFPLYSYVRRQGLSEHDAQDLTQGFFAYLIEKKGLVGVDRGRGRFRSYLLGAMKNFLANHWRRLKAGKRGEGKQPISIEGELAEAQYQNEPVDHLTPEHLYDRQWAMALLAEVLEELKRDYKKRGKLEQFEVLSRFLSWNEGGQTYEEAGNLLGQSVGSVKVLVHRMRQRYRSTLMDHISQTVLGEDEAEKELQHLMESLAR